MTTIRPQGLSKFFVATVGAFVLASGADAAPGDHLRAGNLTVTPSVALGFGYRSNAFRSETTPRSAGLFTLTPAVVGVLEGPEVSLTAGARYGIQKYVFLQDAPPNGVSNLDRFNNFNVDFGLKAFKTSPVGLSLSDSVGLINNPVDIDLSSDDPYTTQLRNQFKAGLDLRPGPALVITPGFVYTWSQFFVPESDAIREPFNARNSYGFTLASSWKFLPRTALVVNGSYLVNQWQDNAPEIAGGPVQINDSRFVNVQAGVQGRISKRLRIIAKAGYGVGIYEGGTNASGLDGLTGALQGDYSVSDSHKLSLGVRKAFFDSFFTDYVGATAIYGGWSGKYGEKLSSSLNLGTRFEAYNGPVERRDQVTTLTARVGYDANKWFNMSVGGAWLQRASDAAASDYDDVQANLAATFTY